MASTNSSTKPNPVENENPDPTWQAFKLTRSSRRVTGMEHDFHLLKASKTSILGDICILVRDDEYTFDRVIPASKSNRSKNLILLHKKDDIVDEITDIMPEGTSLNHHTFDVFYGKDVKCVMNENNFVKLLYYIQIIKMEADLEIFKQFIENTIKPKTQLNIQMFDLLVFLSRETPCFNYLLPIVSQYFSCRLLDIYQKKEFLSLSAEGFIPILLHKSNNHLEKRSIGRVCAEWICHDYQNRIKNLKDLVNAVNATKYRYGFLPYCHWDPNLKTKSLQKNHSSNESNVLLVEKYFNKLLFYLGEAKFDTPSELRDKLNSMQSGNRIVFPTNPTVQSVSLLEKEIFRVVAINVQGSTFKLHRIKLSSLSGYFYDLFTNPSEPLIFEVDKTDEELKICNYELDQIDPETFRSIVQYIYRQEIEVTSKNHLISLLKGSKFLKMDELFENCASELLKILDCDFSAEIVEIFQYVRENGKCSELYDTTVKRIIGLWSKLDENPKFPNISLDTLTEIVALPRLEIDNPDEVLDLCSKWIFYDVENRYKYTIEVAKAINRNFMMDTEQLKLDMPQNSIDFSQQYVKRQLIRILSSTVLVPENTKNVQRDKQKPCFLTLNTDSLCVLDANFNEIIQLSGVHKIGYGFWSSATVIDNELFILFCNGNFEFYFQLYHISSKRMISLASDARMDPRENFEILSCNDEVYYCNDKIILKYSVQLNRWVRFLKDDKESHKQYTSDGENLYKIFSIYNKETDEWENKTSYYDFEQNGWTALPNIPIKTEPITNGKVNIIKRELSVLLKSKTFSFSWVTQKWTEISNCSENFLNFTSNGKNILYVSDKKEVHLYSPVRNDWMLQKKLDVVGSVKTINKFD